jgi:MFS family permease
MVGARGLGVLGAMYVTQGLVYGFAAFVLLPTLAAAGVALEAQTGILALAGLPWVFKLLWGPVIDAYAPRGRGPATFAAAGMVAIAVALAAMASVPATPANVTTLAVTWLLLNVALSLQDVATDAIALDTIAPGQRGLANGVMLGGHHLGFEALGGLALGALVAAQGLRMAMFGMVAAVVVLAAALRWAPAASPAAGGPKRRPLGEALAVLERLVMDRRAVTVALVAAGVMFADVLTAALSAEFWVNRLGWTVAEVSGVLPKVLLPANLVGFGVAALLADRVGHRRMAAGGTVALGASWVVFAALSPWWTDAWVLLSFVAVQALATAAMYVGVHAALMDATDPRARATHFAALTALLNSPRVVAPLLAAPLLGALGWGGVFAACGVVQMAWALALARLPTGGEGA